MSRWESTVIIKEFILQDGSIAGRDFYRIMIIATTQRLNLAIRQIDIGCGVARHGDIPVHMLQGLLPLALHYSVWSLVISFYRFAVLNTEGWLQHDVLVSHAGISLSHLLYVDTLLLDASQILIAPGKQVTQKHHMIARIHLRISLVAIPEFPDGSSSVLCHITPRRIGALSSQEISHIRETIVAQTAKEPGDADDTAVDMFLGIDADALHYLLDEFAAQLLGSNAEGERQEISGRGIVAIIDAVWIKHMTRTTGGSCLVGEELLVESFYHPASAVCPSFCFFLQTLQVGKLLCQLQTADHISGGYQLAIGLSLRILTVNQFQLLWWYAPVAVFILGDDAVLIRIFCQDMVDPFPNGWIRIDDRLLVAKLMIEHITGERQGCRPGNIIGIIIPEGRSHIRNIAIRTLGIADIVHPLAVESLVVENETFTQRPHRMVAQPRLALVALRTVYRHTLVIAIDAPPCILQHLI